MGVNGIYGLSGSGLDIESLVKMGMSSKNKQYDKMEQKEIANTWLKEAYNDVYNDMTTYKYGTLSTYKMQSNLNAMSATSSNSSVVTASANGAAAAMNHTVTVSSIASNAYLLTTQDENGKNYGIHRVNTTAPDTDLLADIIFKGYTKLSESDDGVGYYNVNLADGTGINVSGSDVAISLTLRDKADSDTTYNLTYTYDDLFSGEKTLSDLASAIAKTGANIQGGYDYANDTFSLYNKTSGKENIIGLVADNTNTANLLNNLNLGAYNSATNELGDRISFTADNIMPTTMESTSVSNSAKSVTLKDVLGLSATSVKNDDNTYTISVSYKDGDTTKSLGSFTKNLDGTYTGNTTAFSMNLSNGTTNATVSFTLGELFNLDDIGSRSSLRGNAGLDELAAKISSAGVGVTAKYDAATDSFSLNNPTGQAALTANGTGNAQTVANRLISSLNLADKTGISQKVTTNTGTLAAIFGVTATATGNMYGNTDMTISQDGSAVATLSNRLTADFLDGTIADTTLFKFNLSDGTNSAMVDITYGDVINFADMSAINNSTRLKVKDSSGNPVELENRTSATVQAAQNNLQALADKINTAAKNNGLKLSADYNSTSGVFNILTENGTISLTDAVGSAVSKLNLTDANPSNSAYKVSTGITRVNDYSSEDALGAAVGLTAVKNSNGTLTVTDADGNTSTVNASATALTLTVGDGTNQKDVSFTYADLFDTTGSGALKYKADLSSLAEKINDLEGVNVTAAYDADKGKFTLSNTKGYATLTGANALGTSLVSKLGLTESEETASARDHTWAGTNATVTIDGKSYDNATNKLTVAGVTYTFLENTKAGDKATISVSQDTDKIVDYMKSFVDDYNKLLDSLNEKLSEQKYSDYKPLSKRQEDEMTEKQIEKWNEKAKSGILYHNSTIRDLVSAMREAIYTKVDAVDSEYNTLASIGITTTNTKGHLTIDTNKLKNALAADPDCVYQLFASDQDSSYIAGSTNKNSITNAQKKMDYSNTGVSNRLYNVMTNYMDKISDIAGTSKDTNDQSYLGKLITDMQTKMSNFKTLMTSYENKLYKRYDAMEVALSKLNMQLGYISGSFS